MNQKKEIEHYSIYMKLKQPQLNYTLFRNKTREQRTVNTNIRKVFPLSNGMQSGRGTTGVKGMNNALLIKLGKYHVCEYSLYYFNCPHSEYTLFSWNHVSYN